MIFVYILNPNVSWMAQKRCEWPEGNKLMLKYHDEEWGVPVHEDRKLFEFLLLDSFQAGLSWQTILNKRENFKKAFDNFDAEKIAKYDRVKKKSFMQGAGLVNDHMAYCFRYKKVSRKR